MQAGEEFLKKLPDKATINFSEVAEGGCLWLPWGIIIAEMNLNSSDVYGSRWIRTCDKSTRSFEIITNLLAPANVPAKPDNIAAFLLLLHRILAEVGDKYEIDDACQQLAKQSLPVKQEPSAKRAKPA